MKNSKQIVILSIPIIIVLVGIAILYLIKPNKNDQQIFVGLFETTEIKIASEIPGRIDAIHVKLGDKVIKGEILATIESDILDAKMQQAKGIYTAAESLNSKANKGARMQQIQAADDKYEMARSQYVYAQNSFNRVNNMFKDSLVSTQKMDEVTFKRDAAKKQMDAAKSIYNMAVEGARAEDKEAAKGQLSAVEGKVNEAKAYYKELQILAPVDGEISAKLAEESEVMPAGYPIFTILKLEDIYAVLNVREDYLKNFKIGTEIKGVLPAFDNQSQTFKVTYIAPMADFADWIPTADKGRLDMKTFEIRLTPTQNIEGLRPGMSVQIEL